MGKYKKQKKILAITIFSIILFVTSCGNLMEGKNAAEIKISEFHANYNNQDFDSIYQNAHKDFRKAVDINEFKEYMSTVHRKLGITSSTTTQNYNVKAYNLVTTVEMIQETNFEKGTATELFVYSVKDKDALLVQYSINSRALIIN